MISIHGRNGNQIQRCAAIAQAYKNEKKPKHFFNIKINFTKFKYDLYSFYSLKGQNKNKEGSVQNEMLLSIFRNQNDTNYRQDIQYKKYH
jgi:hypothetical protein